MISNKSQLGDENLLDQKTAAGKQREWWSKANNRRINDRHPHPARQAGWKQTGRYVTRQGGNVKREEIGC